jgi:hypothetical protein
MRFSPTLLAMAAAGLAACGPTYVVQSPRQPAPQRVPVPPRVEPLEVSVVRSEDNRVLVQTSRPSYVAVFEIIPGRGVSLVYPAPYRPRDVTLTGLTWVNVYWTMRPENDRRYASSETRYIYAIASDTPLQLSDQDYDRDYLQRQLGSAYWSTSPNVAVRAISREVVRSQPDEWWGEDMYSMSLTNPNPRVTVTIHLARVYCPGGTYFEVRDDFVDHVWCPARATRPGERPVAAQPDSVFGSNGRRLPRHVDPSPRTPIFRVPTDVGQQQGEPTPPRNPVPNFPRTRPQNPQMPAANQPGQNQPPQTQPPQNQPPQTQPLQNQPPQTQPPQDPTGGKAHDDNGRRAHGEPRNADPRGNGNGYGNGGREQPATQTPANTPPANTTPAGTPPGNSPQPNPQPQQHGNPQTPAPSQPGNGHQNQGNSNPGNSANAGNNGNSGNHGNSKGPDNAKPDHNDAPRGGVSALLKNRAPQAQKQPDKKAGGDSTEKKKP